MPDINTLSDLPATLCDEVMNAYIKFDSSDCDPAVHAILISSDGGVSIARWSCDDLASQIGNVGRGGVAAESVRVQMRETAERLQLDSGELLRVVVATPPRMYVLHMEKPTVFDG